MLLDVNLELPMVESERERERGREKETPPIYSLLISFLDKLNHNTREYKRLASVCT